MAGLWMPWKSQRVHPWWFPPKLGLHWGRLGANKKRRFSSPSMSWFSSSVLIKGYIHHLFTIYWQFNINLITTSWFFEAHLSGVAFCHRRTPCLVMTLWEMDGEKVPKLPDFMAQKRCGWLWKTQQERTHVWRRKLYIYISNNTYTHTIQGNTI